METLGNLWCFWGLLAYLSGRLYAVTWARCAMQYAEAEGKPISPQEQLCGGLFALMLGLLLVSLLVRLSSS